MTGDNMVMFHHSHFALCTVAVNVNLLCLKIIAIMAVTAIVTVTVEQGLYIGEVKANAKRSAT